MQSTRSFILSYLKKLPLRLIVLLAMIAGALFLFSYMVHEVLWEQEEEVDNAILKFLSDHVVSDGLTGFMKSVTYFASSTFMQIGYGCLIILYLVLKNIKRAFEIATIGVGGYLINYVMKLSFQRLRPPHPLIDPLNNFSFPSGHATSGFIFYGLLAYLLWKTDIPKTVKYLIAIILVLFSLLIGFSRVYLRVHYPSDVAAGFCIGFAWLLLAIYLMEKVKKKSGEETRETINGTP